MLILKKSFDGKYEIVVIPSKYNKVFTCCVMYLSTINL